MARDGGPREMRPERKLRRATQPALGFGGLGDRRLLIPAGRLN